MEVVFRVDASRMIGSGHIMRCLTLAEELRRRDIESSFICRDHIGNLTEKVTAQKFSTFVLPNLQDKEQAGTKSNLHTSWLGCDWQTDANQTKRYLDNIQPEWLIVDHYALDKKWEKFLYKNYRQLMVIDDIADRQHECDLLLDQNLFKNMSERYQGKVPEKCIQLLGPKYALLQSNYAESRANVKFRKTPLKNLLVFFGGVDMHNLTGLTLSALEQINMPFECIDVVISQQSPNYRDVSEQARCLPKVQMYSDLPSLAPLMMKADLAIGGGGATSWERLCLGLPSLVITLAENQRKMNFDLHEIGLVELVGDVNTVQIKEICLAIKNALSSNSIKEWSERCMQACSGEGASLVVDNMLKISGN